MRIDASTNPAGAAGLALLLGALCAAGCSMDRHATHHDAMHAHTIDIDAERQALLETDRAWARAAGRGGMDVDDVLAFWTDDAQVFLSGTTRRIAGRDAIRAFVLEGRATPGFTIDWKPEFADVSACGDLGYTYGVGTITRGGGEQQSTAVTYSYVLIWRKQQDGTWKCVLEN